MATEENWENILRTNRSCIQMLIELDSGLWGELKTRNLFTKRQLDNIWPQGKKMTIDRVESLLEMLEKKTFSTFQKFCEALEVTGQGRVVKEALSRVRETEEQSPLIAADSVDGQMSPLCCPLSPTKLYFLKCHWNDIVEKMITDADVFGKLTEKKVFTEFQLKTLKDYHEESTRNEMFLHRLEKASEWQFNAFCDILIATNQLVIANYLRPFHVSRSFGQCPSTGSLQSASDNQQVSLDAKQSSLSFASIPLQSITEDSIPKELTEIEFGCSSPQFRAHLARSIENETAYKCNSRPLGRALIINNEYFSLMSRRTGAQEDSRSLKFLFEKLHFEPEIHENLTIKDITELLKAESQVRDHRSYDAFVLFLLSHGKKNEIFGRDEKSISIDQITSFFDGKNCPSLINKPKLFFIQACQGDVKTKGVVETDSPHSSALHSSTENSLEAKVKDMKLSEDCNIERSLEIIESDDVDCRTIDEETEETEEHIDEVSQDVTSNHEQLVHDLERSLSMDEGHIECDDSPVSATHEKADMAIAYSTAGGYVALRHSQRGSFFVQCLLKVFSQRAHEDDLLSMLTEVFKKLHEQTGNIKQIGEKRDTLRRKVYLLPRQDLHSDLQTSSLVQQ